MKKSYSIFLVFAIFAFSNCQKSDIDEPTGNSGQGNNNSSWLIPEKEVRDGGPGKDGIPALSNHSFIDAGQISYLSDTDLVLGFADGDEVRAYPHPILDWHEIINDDTENHSLAVIYCPLTGTGIGWDRMINQKKTTFGVSGLLYNNNIIPYDRETDSNWSQLLLKAVNGKLMGEQAKTYNLVETNWKTWKEMFPASKVISTQTGYNRNYGRYPYGDYKTNKNLLFPVSNKDTRLHEKERVLAVIVNGKANIFRFARLEGSNNLILDEFLGTKLVVTGGKNANIMIAFNRVLAEGNELSFTAVLNELPVILADNEGNKWDIFGRAVSGPRKGQKLQPVTQMMGYWFAFAAFYPDLEVSGY